MMEIISHLLAISGVLVLVSLLYNLWRVRIVSNKNNGILPPEPSGALPIIGHIHKFLGKIPMFRTMAAMADKHGPTFMFRFGLKRALVISNHGSQGVFHYKRQGFRISSNVQPWKVPCLQLCSIWVCTIWNILARDAKASHD